jgi:CDGSH-type Zn-finger protein
MSDVTVTVTDSGPYLVAGPVTLADADGTAYTVEREVIALCRCGHSANKPFCDGSHTAEGFSASERAS